MPLTHIRGEVFFGKRKSQFPGGTFEQGAAFGNRPDIFHAVKTSGKDHVLDMAGIHGHFHRLLRVVRVIPIAVLFELVTENAVYEVLNAGIRPAPVTFRNDVFHRLDTHLFDTGKRPEYFIGSVVGEELRSRAVDVRRHDLG